METDPGVDIIIREQCGPRLQNIRNICVSPGQLELISYWSASGYLRYGNGLFIQGQNRSRGWTGIDGAGFFPKSRADNFGCGIRFVFDNYIRNRIGTVSKGDVSDSTAIHPFFNSGFVNCFAECDANVRTRGINIGKCRFSGYMSVETAYVFVTALSVIIFVISVGLYQYDKCTFELESLYELQKTMQTGKDTQEYIDRDETGILLSRQKETGLYLGIFGEKDVTMHIEVKVYEPDPVMVLRLKQSLERVSKNEYMESE